MTKAKTTGLHLPQQRSIEIKETEERIVVEVPEEMHRAVKTRAAALGMSVKAYTIHAFDTYRATAEQELAADPDRKLIEGSWHQKRVAFNVKPEKVAEIKEAIGDFKTMRELLLRCIEVEMRTKKG